MAERLSRCLWYAVLLITAVYLAMLDWSSVLSTNVLDLLPADKNEETWVVQQMATGSQGRVVLGVLEGPAAQRERWADGIVRDLEGSGLFVQVLRLDRAHGFTEPASIWWEDRFALRFPLWLSAAASDGGVDPSNLDELVLYAVERLEAFYEDPGYTAFEGLVPGDPLLLMYSGLLNWMETGLAQRFAGAQGHTLFWLEQKDSPFSEAGQGIVLDRLLGIPGLWAAEDVALRWRFSGAVSFATANRTAMQREITRLNLLIPLLVIAVIGLSLRQVRILIPVVCVVLSGVAGASVATVLLLGQLHVLTLVLGSILAGVAADYALHLLARNGSLRSVNKPLLIGVFSTVIGFLVFLLSDLPVLRQMAIFVAAGLIFAAVTALVLSLWVAPVPNRRASSVSLPDIRLKASWLVPAWLVAVSGLFWLTWRDDLSDLEYPLPEVRLTDQTVRAAFGDDGAQVPVVVFAHQRDTMLHRMEYLLTAIEPAGPVGPTVDVWLPGSVQIAFTRQWLEQHAAPFAQALYHELYQAGFDPEAFESFFADWSTFVEAASDPAYFDAAMDRFQYSLNGPLAGLYPAANTGQGLHMTTLILEGADQQELLDKLAGLDGVLRLDTLGYLNQLFSRYRVELWIFSAIGLLLLTLVVVLAYSWRLLPWLVGLPLATLLATLGLLGWWLSAVNLFHLVGCILGFCLALDYGLFALTCKQLSERFPRSVHLSAATTFTAFVLLATSSIPAVQALGLTVALMVLLGWFSSLMLFQQFTPSTESIRNLNE